MTPIVFINKRKEFMFSSSAAPPQTQAFSASRDINLYVQLLRDSLFLLTRQGKWKNGVIKNTVRCQEFNMSWSHVKVVRGNECKLWTETDFWVSGEREFCASWFSFYKMCMLGFSSCWNERKMQFLYFCVCMYVCVSVCVCVCVMKRT